MTTLTIALLAWYALGGVASTAVAIPMANRIRKINRRNALIEQMMEAIEANPKNYKYWNGSRVCQLSGIHNLNLAWEVLGEYERNGIFYRRPSNKYNYFYKKN